MLIDSTGGKRKRDKILVQLPTTYIHTTLSSLATVELDFYMAKSQKTHSKNQIQPKKPV